MQSFANVVFGFWFLVFWLLVSGCLAFLSLGNSV